MAQNESYIEFEYLRVWNCKIQWFGMDCNVKIMIRYSISGYYSELRKLDGCIKILSIRSLIAHIKLEKFENSTQKSFNRTTR